MEQDTTVPPDLVLSLLLTNWTTSGQLVLVGHTQLRRTTTLWKIARNVTREVTVELQLLQECLGVVILAGGAGKCHVHKITSWTVLTSSSGVKKARWGFKQTNLAFFCDCRSYFSAFFKFKKIYFHNITTILVYRIKNEQ